MFPIATRSFRFLAFDPEVELLFDDEDFDETFFVVVVVVFASFVFVLALENDDDDKTRVMMPPPVPPNVPNRPTFERLAKRIDAVRCMSPSSKVASASFFRSALMYAR